MFTNDGKIVRVMSAIIAGEKMTSWLGVAEVAEAATEVIMVGSKEEARTETRTGTRRGDQEREGRAIIGKAILALTISILLSKAYGFWR